jgi:hypothetical protein
MVTKCMRCGDQCRADDEDTAGQRSICLTCLFSDPERPDSTLPCVCGHAQAYHHFVVDRGESPCEAFGVCPCRVYRRDACEPGL